MVILHHYSSTVDAQDVAFGWNPALNNLGATGVDLFFVLSGFLISGLLFSEYKVTGSIDVKRFWIRRGLKIYPAFYCLMAVTAIFFLATSRRVPIVVAYESLFLQGYLPQFWPHTWSLAVEEHFYFVLPLVVFVLIRLRAFRLIPWISIAASVGCLLMRIHYSNTDPAWQLHVAYRSVFRFDALFAGVALGYYQHFDETSFREARKHFVLVLGLLLAAALMILPNFLNLTIAYVAYACIVAWSAHRERSRSVVARALAYIGFYSYSIYLWHGILMFVLWFMPRHWIALPLYVAAVLALGIGMSKLIELPALRIREQLWPSRSSRSRSRSYGQVETVVEPIV